MSRIVRIAVCSTPNVPLGETDEEKHAYNVETAEDLLAQAAAQGADVACLPEMFPLRGIKDWFTDTRWYEKIPGGLVFLRMAAAARMHNMNVIAPVIGVEDGAPRNAAMVFDRSGTYVGSYHKVHLTVSELEVKKLVPGDHWPVFDLDFGRIGITTCYDIMFPEAFRIPALKGAEIIFHPTVYGMFGEPGWEAVIKSRAIDNCVYVCVANHGVRDEEPWMPGMSMNRSSVIGPDGVFLADRGRYWGVAVAQVDLDRPRMVLADVGGHAGPADIRQKVWYHRRPETYHELTEEGYWVQAGYPNHKVPAGETS